MEKEGTEKAFLKIGFLYYKEFNEGKRYRGAILITDETGKPLEFRATSPVCPNPLQKILYGKRLLPHILVELIGFPLITALKEKPSCLLVTNRGFLALQRKVDSPVISLRPQGEFSPSREESAVLIESDTFQPIVIEVDKNCTEDMKGLREKLRGVYQNVDLLEPFERVEKAIEEVEKRKILEEGT